MSHERSIALAKLVVFVVVGLPMLLLGFLLIPSCGASQHVQIAGYSAEGSRLYVYEYRQKTMAWGLPFPEKPPERSLSSSYRLAYIDLEKPGPPTPVGKPLRLDGGEGGGGDAPTSLLFDGGEPRLASYNEIEQRLRRTVNPPCKFPEIVGDRQDARILYFYCAGAREVHRFLPPYTTAVSIVLPPGGGIETFQAGEHFHSTIDEPYLFVPRGKMELFRVDVTARVPAVAVPRFPVGEEPFAVDMRPAEVLKSREYGDEPLIGITPSLRVYELKRGNGMLEVGIVENGQAPRRMGFKDPLIDDLEWSRTFIAPIGYVVWRFGGFELDSLVTLNLRTGKFSTLKLPERI